ncbi:MAG: hypothetical protein ACO3HA_08255 [Burkholderiales bacterium]
MNLEQNYEALRAENEKLANRIDRLEWENKGVAEWRGEWAKMRDQRDAAWRHRGRVDVGFQRSGRTFQGQALQRRRGHGA